MSVIAILIHYLYQKITSMKRLLLVLFAGLLMSGCQQSQEEEIERLNMEKQALQEQIQERDSTLNEFFGTLNQIEDNLQAIKEREGMISRGAGAGLEGRPDAIENINEDIRLIGELMEKNRQLMARLTRDFNASNVRIAEFEKMVTRLGDQIQEKEIEIQMLQEELSRKNLQVESLVATLDTLREVRRQQERIIEEKILEMNTAYYVMGSREELREQGIMVREGGFLGIGRTNRLGGNFNLDYFTRVDVTRTSEVTIPGRRPVLVSAHPEGSWRLRREDDMYYLEILDKEKFWSASRYLVIEME